MGSSLPKGTKEAGESPWFKHNNMDDLEKVLGSIPLDEPKLIVVDGVFSMEGDIAKLPAIRKLADTYRAGIYLDEAHALGVVGKNGRGTCGTFRRRSFAVRSAQCTFSKSFGSIGGFIAGEEQVIDYIKHFARPLDLQCFDASCEHAATMKALDLSSERNPSGSIGSSTMQRGSSKDQVARISIPAR